MSYCGSYTVMGHGDGAICGKPYIDGIYQCPHCKLKDLERKPMLMTHSPEYAQLQADFHKQRPDYGISGHKYADPIAQLAKNLNTRDILDYGAGKCTLQKSLPFPIQNYDPFILEHAARPLPADLVVCTDVMEHIEPDFIQNVIQDIHSLTKRAAFFQIATRPASKQLPDGRNAHLVVQPANWWLQAFLPFFSLKAFQELNGGFIMVVEPIRSKPNA